MKKFLAILLALAVVAPISIGCGDTKKKATTPAAGDKDKDKPADTGGDKDK